MFLHAIQKYNTIRMMDEVIRYPIYLASTLGIEPFKAFSSVSADILSGISLL